MAHHSKYVKILCSSRRIPRHIYSTSQLLSQNVFSNYIQQSFRYHQYRVFHRNRGPTRFRETSPPGLCIFTEREFKKTDSPPRAATMSKSIFFPRDLPRKGIVYSGLEKNKSGGKQAYVSTTDSKNKVYVQFPAMMSPFGISAYKDPGSGQILSYNVDLSFRDAENNPKVADCLNMIEYLDSSLLKHATENSEAWFGKKLSEEMVAEFMRPLLRNSNPEYPPSVRLKIPVVNGMETCRFFDDQKNEVSLEYASKKGSVLMVICEISPIWFVSKSFGMTLKALQIAAVKVPNQLNDYAFMDDGDPMPMEEEEEGVQGEDVIAESAPTTTTKKK